MSSGQGDNASAKSDEETEMESTEKSDKIAPEDQVDHAAVPSLDKDSSGLQQLIIEDSSNKTDSGFKDNLPSFVTDKLKSNSDNTDDNSDDDLELKWEDDDSDEQNGTQLENVSKAADHVSEISKPVDADVEDTNLSSVSGIDEKTGEIDENKLLESSPSGNEDTNLSSTSDTPKTTSPMNKIVENEAVSGNVEEIIDENQLLEGPESDTIDEDKLLEIPDESKDDSLLDDDLIDSDSKTTKVAEVNITEISRNNLEKATNSKLIEAASAETSNELDRDNPNYSPTKNSATLVVNADMSVLDATIQEQSQVTMSTSSPNESMIDTSLNINKDHGLNKPDMMLEIPTQEIIDLDDTDLLISGANDEEMQVDSSEDSFKTAEVGSEKSKPAATLDHIVEMDVDNDVFEEESDAIIVKPEDMLQKLDAQSPSKDGSESKKTKNVSEDDWSEIERRLEGFEESFSEEAQLKKKSKESDDKQNPDINLQSQSESNDNTEIQPLTDAQKLVIETENKALLKTLQDTSQLDTTEEQMSTTMEEEALLDPEIKNQSIQEANKVDISTETVLESKIDPPVIVTSESEEKEPEISSDLDQPLNDTDPKPMSPIKCQEEIEVHQVETKINTEVPSDVSINKENITKPLKTLNIHESSESVVTEESKEITEQQSEHVDNPVTILEPVDVQMSITTSQSIAEGDNISSAAKDVEVIEKQHAELSTDANIEAKSTTDDMVASKVTEDDVIPSTSISVDEAIVSASTTIDKDDEAQSSTMEVEPSTVSKEDEVPPLSIPEKESPTVTFGLKLRPIASLMPFDPSTSTLDSQVKSTISEMYAHTSIDLDNATPTIEAVPSTSKVDEAQPSTSKQPDADEVHKPTEVPSNTDGDSDEVPEISDSLGLLAESSRVVEDDEDAEDDDDPDGDDGDDDDYDPEDESSNQMTAEHSEDSNAPHSETDVAKYQDEKEMEIESPVEEKGEEQFSFTADKDAASGEEKDGAMEVDEVVVQDEIEVTPEQIGSEPVVDDVMSTEIDDKPKEDVKEKPKKTAEQTVKQAEKDSTESVLRKILNKGAMEIKKPEAKSPVMSIVDLEESSSEDDIQEVKKAAATDNTTQISIDKFTLTIPGSLKVTSVAVDAPSVGSEVTVGDDNDTDATTDSKPSEDKPKPKLSLEIFSLDSDEEESTSKPADTDHKQPSPTPEKPRSSSKCINIACTTPGKVPCYRADSATIAYFDAGKRKKPLVCEACADIVVKRTELLIKGIKELAPLLELDTGRSPSELVEISDSESEDEADLNVRTSDVLADAGFIEANLAKMINDTWDRYRLDSRLADAEDDINKEIEKLEAESKDIDAMLTECQLATDNLRNDLYATFEQKRKELNAIIIYDTPLAKYIRLEDTYTKPENPIQTRSKRRMSSASENAAKKPAIPLGYTPLEGAHVQTQDNKPSQPSVENTKADDDKDISVLKVSAEMAPSDLPPPGELFRPPLKPGMFVYTMRNALGSWSKSRILDVNGKTSVQGMLQTYTVCRVRYENKPKGSSKLAPARCMAYADPATVRLTIGTRVIALFKDAQNPLKKDAFYSGIIAEVPNPVNNYRYLVFFDDGYAQYVQHRDTRVVCECASLVWEEVHPVSREFVKEYLMAYPERPMVRLHAGQSLKTEWNGKWWASRVIQVDASLVQVHFEEDNRTEWIYRGSTRLAPLFLELQAAERHRARPMPRTKGQARTNMPYVEYTRSDEQASKTDQPATQAPPSDREIRQRAVAKKSTAMPPMPNTNIPAPNTDSVTSRVVYYTPKNAVKPYKMTTHNCGPHCKRKDVLALKDLRTYNPLAKPLLSGWERQIVRFKGHKEVMYRAPCGRRLRSMRELHRYLRLVQSDMAVDLFDFTPHTHCLAEFVLNKCLVGKKDLSHGKENVPVPCVNYYDESLPEFCSYNTERTPTAGVPLNLDPEFLCGCDCTDDCEDKSKCACWQMTLEGARTIGLEGPSVGYKYKRLPEPLPSGIYECNSRCKCKQTCLNRVAQHPLQLKLQVFKTLNRGWGIRALNDVPKGSFLCVYAGNLLTDATANMDGLNEGDEYLAELDYIEVVEQMKEGYEEDIPEADKKLDKNNTGNDSEESEMSSSEEEDDAPSKNEQEDGDFCPGYIETGYAEFNKRLRKRDKNKKKKEDAAKEKEAEKEKGGDDCITISDDEEVREPSRFMAQAGMGREFISKYRSVRAYFGKDEACYIMDAKVQGNIGRYLNHSCQPNVFVQNVFVDTHDPRFPWVAFFALSHIKAGTELTWNYNYDVGSVPGKVLYCYCGAPNCRGRLL